MKEPPKEKIEWDKKKIIAFSIFLFILMIGLYKLKTIVLDKDVSGSLNNQASVKRDVKAASTINPGQSIQKTVQEEVNNLKTEAAGINLVDIATSSPQMQKVINDLKALQSYPSDQLKSTCINVCNKL